MKGGVNQNSAVVVNKNQGNSTGQQTKLQPTAEQIRYAKLAQLPGLEESKIQEKIKEVSEVTGKASDVVSVALHESNYEVSVAIQNILDGQYECLDTEWQTKPSKKKKTPLLVPGGSDKTENEEEAVANYLIIDEEEKAPLKSSKAMHSGRRGGRAKRLEERPEERPMYHEADKDNDSRNDSGLEKGHSFERGKGRPRGRGRGGVQRGAGGRRGGFGGRSRGFSGSGRGSSRVRGKGLARRPGSDKDQQNNTPNEENNSTGLVIETETWDIDEFEDKPGTDWADDADAEKSEDWSQDQWTTPVSEDNTASLFANSIMSSSAQSEKWNHVNGPDTSWGRLSPSQQQEESLYRPENVDAAVIMSQRAQPTSGNESMKNTNDVSRPVYTSSLHNNQFPSNNQEPSLTSSLLGQSYNIEDLAKSFKLKNHVGEGVASDISATMISGVHESHKLEQEQIQPSKAQRQRKPKRPQKPQQIPSQPVEMPKSVMEELEQQLGGLEFGSGPVSPKFESDSKQSFVPTSTITTTIFQQSTPSNLASTVHHETARHSVAIPEDPSSLSNTSSLPTVNASKSDRPKTPPGLSSLPPEHQSPARHYSPSSGRDLNRIVQVPNPIPFPSNSRSQSQSLVSTATLNQPTDSLQASLGSSFSNPRSALKSIPTVQESSSVGLSKQAMMGLSDLPLNSHLQQKQKANSYSNVDDAFASASIAKTKSPTQPMTAASLAKSSIAPPPGVLPSSAHVTYSSSTLASQVLGFASTQTTTAAHTSLKTQPNTNKMAGSGPPGMMPVNMYPGMQQGMVPAAYQAYSYEDVQMLQRMPIQSYYEVMLQTAGANRESSGSNFQAGDSKFARDASSPVASSINTGNPHAAHAQQQAAFLNATQAYPYGYAYYTPSMMPGTFPVFTTAAVYQMPTGKGHMGGAHYQNAYTTQHTSHAYNSVTGGSQDFDKGHYQRSASQSLQHNKNGQASGTLSSGSSSTENIHPTGYKSQQFNQDGKSYQLTATPPSMSIPLPHGQSHMTSFTPYMMQHHASMMHQTAGHLGHQQLDSTNQASLIGRSQQHHGMATTQQPKRDVKGQGLGSYWPGSN